MVRYRNWLACVVVQGCLAACSDSTEATVDAASDDVGVAGDLADEETTAAGPPCSELLVIDTPFDIAPGDDGTQIHANAAFDGQALWIVYSLPDPEHAFDIMATRISCDGEVLVAPTRLNRAFDANEIDASVAVSGDRVLFAWSADNGSAPYNLDLFVDLWTTDGEPLWEDERLFEGVLGGDSNPGNAWMSYLVSAGDDGFVMAASWGVEAVSSFQVFVQRFDRDGEPVGEAIDVSRADGVSQTEPAAAVLNDGTVIVTWHESEFEGPSRLLVRRFDREGEPLGAATEVRYGVDGSRVDVAVGPANRVLLAVSSDSDPRSDISVVDLEGETVAGWETTSLDHTPALAINDDGTASVVWFRHISGFRNELWSGAVGGDSEPVKIDVSGPVAPYESTLVGVGDGAFFTLWSEGESPDFILRGTFLRP
jgi:hypothetical protein